MKDENTIRSIARSHLKMMLFSIITVLLALVISHLFNKYYPLSKSTIAFLEYSGYICWGTTLSSLGTKIPKKQDSSEALFDQILTTGFSMLGIFVFTMGSALKPPL